MWATAQPAIVFAERRGEVANGATRAVSPSLDFGLCRRPDLGAHNPSGADASPPRHAHSADDIREPEPAGIGPPMVRASGIARAIERKPKIIPKATLAVRMTIPLCLGRTSGHPIFRIRTRAAQQINAWPNL